MRSTYVLTVLDKGFHFLDENLCISTSLDVNLCFDCARLMFRLCSTYVLTFSTKIGCASTVLDLSFGCIRPIFWPMVRLCPTYFLSFSTKYKKNTDIFFYCTRSMFRLCFRYISTLLDLCFDCVSRAKIVCFDCAWPMFRFSGPKMGMFWLCSTYVSTFSTKIGYILTPWIKIGFFYHFVINLKLLLDRSNFSSKTALARFSKSKHKSSSSTRAITTASQSDLKRIASLSVIYYIYYILTNQSLSFMIKLRQYKKRSICSLSQKKYPIIVFQHS